MPPSPRVLLSIDYEPWFALTRRHDHLSGVEQRRDLDGGFSLRALHPIFDLLGNTKSSFYLVGEIAEWYPQVPKMIKDTGHELGFHCHHHRSLMKTVELQQDLAASASWVKQYGVRGYRAPMIGIDDESYALLAQNGFAYSSSIYAPAGTLVKKNDIWELPVSTLPLFGHPKKENISAPRNFSLGLLAAGEVPYGSSFVIGLMPNITMHILERQLRAGLSPVIFLHPYELFRPDDFFRKMRQDVIAYPLLLPFFADKSNFLTTLVKNLPVSPLGTYLDEVLNV